MLCVGWTDVEEINELKSAERTKDAVSSSSMDFYIAAVLQVTRKQKQKSEAVNDYLALVPEARIELARV